MLAELIKESADFACDDQKNQLKDISVDALKNIKIAIISNSSISNSSNSSITFN